MNTGEVILNDLLNAAVALIEDPPARQIVTHGEHAVKCELVAVSGGNIRLDRQRGQKCAAIPILTARIVIARKCWPTVTGSGDEPPAAAVTAAGLQLIKDGWDLSTGLQRLSSAGQLFPNATPANGGTISCEGVIVTGSEPMGPFADIAAWRVIVDVHV